jgi:hypothetical protein
MKYLSVENIKKKRRRRKRGLMVHGHNKRDYGLVGAKANTCSLMSV